MSRLINEGPPVPRAFRQARSGDRPWPGDAAWRAQTPPRLAGREPAVVLDIDLDEPLPAITGGAVSRAWLMLRTGDKSVGELVINVPAGGLTPGEIGAAIAAQVGARRRRSHKRAANGQDRSRRRGSTSSL
jgi:hypothetical protein